MKDFFTKPITSRVFLAIVVSAITVYVINAIPEIPENWHDVLNGVVVIIVWYFIYPFKK